MSWWGHAQAELICQQYLNIAEGAVQGGVAIKVAAKDAHVPYPPEQTQ